MTSDTSWPARSTALSVGTAKEGVPQKTSFIARLPLASLLHLANPAQDQVALECAHAAEKKNTVEVVDLVLEGASEQLGTVQLGPFAFEVLCAHSYLRGTRNLLADLRKTQAALFFVLLPFAENDLGVNQNNL